MSPATLHIAYDDVTSSLIPKGATDIGVYINGPFENLEAVRKAFPNARLHTISTTDDGKIANWYDCETGDLTPQQAAACAKRDLEHGLHPGIYASVSRMAAVIAALATLGVIRSRVLLWTAHYNFIAHICSPTSCRYPGFVWDADGTQFTDRAENRSLDESQVTDAWLGIKPKPPVVKPHGTARVELDLDLASEGVIHHGLPGVVTWGSDSATVKGTWELVTGGDKHGQWTFTVTKK